MLADVSWWEGRVSDRAIAETRGHVPKLHAHRQLAKPAMSPFYNSFSQRRRLLGGRKLTDIVCGNHHVNSDAALRSWPQSTLLAKM